MQPLWKSLWSFLQNLKVELPQDSAIEVHRNTHTPMLVAVIFTIVKQPGCPEWAKDMWYIDTMEFDSAVKKKKKRSSVICKKMDGTREHLVKGNKPDSEE